MKQENGRNKANSLEKWNFTGTIIYYYNLQYYIPLSTIKIIPLHASNGNSPIKTITLI